MENALTGRLFLAVLSALTVVLAIAPAAFAGSDLYIEVSNDLRNGAGNGYPKVALVNAGGSDCWYDHDLGNSREDNAAVPGQTRRLWTEVKQGGSPCLDAFKGVRGVNLWIKETPSADWVALEGQSNAGGTDFQMRFGRKSDWNTADDCDKDSSITADNCFSVAGFPQTWSTRPSKVGLWCPVVTSFSMNDKNSRQQVSTLRISVRDDARCNTPRGAVYWPRLKGEQFKASVYPTMSGDVMSPRESRQGDDQPSDGSGDASVVLSILSGTRLMCAWGQRDTPGKESQIPAVCQNAAKPSEYQVVDLTVPTTPPPNYKILSMLSTSDPFYLVGKNEISVPATGPASSPLGVSQTTAYGRTETTTDSVSRTYGGKAGWKYSSKLTAEAAIPFLTKGKTETAWEVSAEFSASGTFGKTEAFQSSTTKQTQVSVSTNAQPGKTTVLRVYKTTFSADYRFRADAVWGVDGKREPVASPAALATGMSVSKSQSCLATVVGDETVTGSIMEFGKRFIDRGGDRSKLTEAEARFLDSIPSFYVGKRDCPGFPAGFASSAGFKGEGVGSMASDAQDSIPIRDAQGNQLYDSDGKPRVQLIDAMALTACVFTAPYPSVASPASRVRLAEATPRATSDFCGAADNGGSVSTSATGTFVDLGDSAAARAGTSVDGTYVSPGGRLAELVVGTAGDNVIRTGGGALDVVEPSAGNDQIHGGDGYDILGGGAGTDAVHGGRGDFQLAGGTGPDIITAENGRGQAYGGAGADRVAVRNVSGTVIGGAGPDQLAGTGAIADATFAGGSGDDAYVFGTGDHCAAVFELPGQGVDTVRTSRCVHNLRDIERIVLTGDQPLAMATGNGTQTIIGSGAANRLSGGIGADEMHGGGGSDLIILGSDAFDTATGGADADRFKPTGTPAVVRGTLLDAEAVAHRLTDFDPGEGDRIILSSSVFGSTVRGLLTNFALVRSEQPQATAPIGTLLFNTRTGLLSFDRDGSRPISPKVIALLPAGVSPSPSMFVIG